MSIYEWKDLSKAMESVAQYSDVNKLVFVYYYVEADIPFFKNLRAGRPYDYRPMIKRSVASVRKFHPDAQIFFLTDANTLIVEADVRIIRLPVYPEIIGYERTRARAEFCKLWKGPILFLEPDMELRRNVQPVFDTWFDIGITHRTEIPGMPINSGIVYVKNTEYAVFFFEDMMPKIVQKDTEQPDKHYLTGYGEQLALADMVDGAGPGMYATDWGRLMIATCSWLNHTYEGNQVWPDNEGPYVLHWKGYRKLSVGE